MKGIEKMENLHFYGLQKMYFSSIKKFDHGLLLLSENVEDTYYNYCAQTSFGKNDFYEIWSKVKSMFPSNRVPALYVTPSSELYGQERQLLHSFERQYTDAWMVMQDDSFLTEFKADNNIVVRPVLDETDFEKNFVETFHIAYSSDDPDDPYGQLSPTYKKALRDSWEKNTQYKARHYLAEYEGQSAGVLTAISYDGYVGVYNVGTISNYRHLGIGKALMSAVAKETSKDDVVFLQTEKGSLAEKWYETMGFQTIFYGECYAQ